MIIQKSTQHDKRDEKHETDIIAIVSLPIQKIKRAVGEIQYQVKKKPFWFETKMQQHNHRNTDVLQRMIISNTSVKDAYKISKVITLV